MKRLPPTPASIPRCISNATSPCTSAMGTPCSTPIFTPMHTSQTTAGVPPLTGLTLPPAMSTPDSNNANTDQPSYFKRYLTSWVSATCNVSGVDGTSLPPTPINIGTASRTNSVLGGEDCCTSPTASMVSPSMNVSCLSGVSAIGGAGGDPAATMRRRSSISVSMMQTNTSTYECRRSMKNYFGRSSNAASTPATTPRSSCDDPAGAIASDIMMRWAKTPPRRCGTPTRARSMSTSACNTPHAKAAANFTSPAPPPELFMNEFDHLPYYSSAASAAAPMDMGMAHSPTFDRLVQRKRENMCSADASELQEIQGLLASQSKRASRPSTPATTASATASSKHHQLHDDPYGMYDASSYKSSTSTTTLYKEGALGGNIQLTSSQRSPHSVLSKMEKFSRSEYLRKNAARLEQYKAVAGNVSEYTAGHIGTPKSTTTTTTTTTTADTFLVSGSAPSTPTKARMDSTTAVVAQTPPNYRNGSRRRSELEEDENISADTPKTNKKRPQQVAVEEEAMEGDSEALSYGNEKMAVFQQAAAQNASSSSSTITTKATHASASVAGISTSLSPRSRSFSKTKPLVEGRVLEGGAPPYPNSSSGRRPSSSQLLRQIQATSSPRTSPPVHTTTRKKVEPQYANLAT